MKEDAKLLDEIDRYLDNRMETDERMQFEQRRHTNEELDQLVVEHIYFRNLLQGSDDKKWARENLQSIMKADQRGKNIAGNTQKVIPLKRHLWTSLAVAASVALLVAAIGIWSVTHIYLKQNKNGYVDLRRAIDNIQRSQNAIMNDMHKNARVPANPGTFGGSGFAISQDGYIVTNYHVIQNSDSVYVQDNKGISYKAKVIYQDAVTDLAILKIIDSNYCIAAPLPYKLNALPANLGEEVFTLGYPKDEVVYGKGYISSETGFRDDTSAYQLSIPVNPGNSGGPLLDTKGNLVGIISGKQSQGEDIAFAVKSSCLRDALDSLPDDFNKYALTNNNISGFSHLNRVDQIHKLEDYVFLVKVYN